MGYININKYYQNETIIQFSTLLPAHGLFGLGTVGHDR